jgi:hypothetical protein
MSAKRTWVWVGIAGILFAAIWVARQLRHPAPSGLARVLPALDLASVTAVQVRPPGSFQQEVRAVRTNHTWQLTEPLVYPGQAESIDRLLTVLQQLVPATYLTPAEMRLHTNADEEFGFASPQASIRLTQGDYHPHLLVGALTAPGDQVFLQVVGDQGAYVVSAELLRAIPRSADDWRDTTLLNPDLAAIDRVAVTNNTKAFVLQRDATTRSWRMIWPFTQGGARADNSRIESALEKLLELKIQKFVPDTPRPAFEAYGLAPPELELALSQGSDLVADLQFGKSPTNNPSLAYGRRAGQSTLIMVARDLLTPWLGPINDFRDPHLLTTLEPVDSIDVKAADTFSVQRQTNGAWRVLPDNFAADAILVREMLTALSNLQIVEFVKDNVTDLGWADFGLAAPARQYTLGASVPPGTVTTNTNAVIAELSFGSTTNQPGKIFARRKDENFVYAVSTNGFDKLPVLSWQLHERRLWAWSENEITAVTIHQHGKTRRLLRNGPHQWALAPGSQGVINELAIEETVRGLIQVSAVAWIERGEAARRRCGVPETDHQIIFELENGTQSSIEFGAPAVSQNIYATVTLEEQPWVFEFPRILFRDVEEYLSVP